MTAAGSWPLAWSDAVCHVYLICTDSKRMFGWVKRKKKEVHISGMQIKFLFSFPVFVQMSMLNWCQKERWCWWVRRASGSCDSSLKFMLDLNRWRRRDRLYEDEKEMNSLRLPILEKPHGRKKNKTTRLKREISFCQLLFFLVLKCVFL